MEALRPIISGGEMNKMVYLSFRQLLNPGQGARIYEDSPLTYGTIKTIQIHWPDGCNGLVGVAVWYGRQIQLIPDIGYLALNDATANYAVNQIKSDKEQVWVDMYNADAINPHRISVTVGIETEDKG